MKKEETEHFGIVSYIFGWISIVFGILQPVLGLGFGIVGLILNSKTQTMKKESKKLNIIGIAISVIVSILGIAAGSYLASKGFLNLR